MLSLIPTRFLFWVRRVFMCKRYYFLPMLSTILYYFMCIDKNTNEIRYLRPSMSFDQRVNVPMTTAMHAALTERADKEQTTVLALIRRYISQGLEGANKIEQLEQRMQTIEAAILNKKRAAQTPTG